VKPKLESRNCTLANTRSHCTFVAALLYLGATVVGCGARAQQSETGGETHFLKSCSSSEGDCGDGLSCVCGVCTRSCDEDRTCSSFPNATCVSPGVSKQCGGVAAVDHCDAICNEDDDCAAVSPFHVCSDGACRTEAPTPIGPVVDAEPPEAGASDTTTPLESDAATGPIGGCERSEMSPNDLLIIGDSFFAQSHQITAYIEGLARASGVLSDGERYRDGSRTVANALLGGGIAQQYLTALDDGPVRVVIMNGGGADALLTTCAAPYDDCTSLTDVPGAAESVLAEMAANGVEDVVYAFYPESRDPIATERVDFLRPRIEAVCANAPLRCHWLDLRLTFDGFMDEYIGPDGLFPTDPGAEASARAIWQLMQENCIAQ
jgi:hypothetical protein